VNEIAKQSFLSSAEKQVHQEISEGSRRPSVFSVLADHAILSKTRITPCLPYRLHATILWRDDERSIDPEVRAD